MSTDGERGAGGQSRRVCAAKVVASSRPDSSLGVGQIGRIREEGGVGEVQQSGASTRDNDRAHRKEKRIDASCQQLIEAIESDCEAVARLLQSCGSSRNFGFEQRQQFEGLLKHRRQLIANLEGLRTRRRSNRMTSGD